MRLPKKLGNLIEVYPYGGGLNVLHVQNILDEDDAPIWGRVNVYWGIFPSRRNAMHPCACRANNSGVKFLTKVCIWPCTGQC